MTTNPYPKIRFTFLAAALLVLTTVGCNCNKNSKIVDVSGIALELDFQRFDVDLMALDTTSLAASVATLHAQYPDFFPLYCQQMMGFGIPEKQDSMLLSNIAAFVQEPTVRALFDTVQKQYSDTRKLEQELTEALKHYKYYFPNAHVPKVVGFVSYFGWSTITYDTTVLGLGLDMHMGSDFEYPTNIPLYIQQALHPEYLLPQAVKVLAGMRYDFDNTEGTLLSKMVSNGKRLYFTDLLLPRTADYLKMDYLQEQIEWCKTNEPEIWKFFVDKELLYTTGALDHRKYLEQGPTTAGMPQDSPGNVGTWVGWQIVKAYMKQFPETTFDLLMALDAQTMLAMSKYKPKR